MSKTIQHLRMAALCVAMTGLTTSVYAASADGDASANVVTPLTVTATATTMDFGDVAAGTVLSTIDLATDGSRTVATGDAEVLTTNTGVAAIFNVNGADGATYSITFPAPGTATLENAGGDTLTVDTFVTNKTGDEGTIGAGTPGDTFSVGATLNLPAGANPGLYSTTIGGGSAYTVTVNYN